MLDFTFTEEQEMIRSMVRDFAIKELAPGYTARVKSETIPPDMIRKMAGLGLLGLNIPEEYGGQPKDAVTVGLVLEELARHAADGAWLVFNGYSVANIVKLGGPETRREWLTAMAGGEKLVLMAATEAEAGSDLANLKTTARKDWRRLCAQRRKEPRHGRPAGPRRYGAGQDRTRLAEADTFPGALRFPGRLHVPRR